MANTTTHKVFISFHHEDEWYKEQFEWMMGDDIVGKAVGDGDIDSSNKVDSIRRIIRDDFIADATVTVVLIGECTWQRKYVDWEIGSSLRDTNKNPRCGLLGILLPTHPDYNRNQFNPHLIPPRLADNCEDSAYAEIYKWVDNAYLVKDWIHAAFKRRDLIPDNSRDQFGRNRTGPCSLGWQN